jgi:two-component system, chemotaxis family, chemotaxis protein CheY
MAKKVVLVGHCGPDSSYLRITVGKAAPGVQVLSADDDASLGKVLGDGVDLLLLNRQLDYGFDECDGISLLKRLRKIYPELKAMLVSNYPEAQAAAVAEGARPGFGKRELGTPRVGELIRDALEASTAAKA